MTVVEPTEPTRRRPIRQDHRLDVLLGTALHRHMGIAAADTDDPDAGITFTVTEPLTNNSGMLHGGLVSTGLDVAAAYAVFPLLTDNEVVLTNSISISYFRPIPLNSQVVIRGEVVRRGVATAFLRVELTVGDELAAAAQVVKSIVTLDEHEP